MMGDIRAMVLSTIYNASVRVEQLSTVHEPVIASPPYTTNRVAMTLLRNEDSSVDLRLEPGLARYWRRCSSRSCLMAMHRRKAATTSRVVTGRPKNENGDSGCRMYWKMSATALMAPGLSMVRKKRYESLEIHRYIRLTIYSEIAVSLSCFPSTMQFAVIMP